ncbi:hypothetical protein [Runella zeae]|uniref:hypothetical protein n=1 Tax=Runella zeae TaxID=94255 RepID=UPI00048DE093|nr:hypothetical protein [Runella zeae]
MNNQNIDSLKNYQIPPHCAQTVKELSFSEVSLEVGVNYSTLSKKVQTGIAKRQFWRVVADACICILNKKIASYHQKINELEQWKTTLNP